MKILCAFGKYAYGNPARGLSYEYVNFMPALRNLGHEVIHFDIWDRSAYSDFAELNRNFLDVVEKHKPDIILTVLMNYELWRETLSAVRNGTDSILINWATDDSWKFEEFSRLIADSFDLYATTDRDALSKASRAGMHNFFMTQWAAAGDHLSMPKSAADCTYDVTFIGSAYGNRKRWIKTLMARGINVSCFGYGWEAGPISEQDVARIIRSSLISLNFGDSGKLLRKGRLVRSRQIKARVFEVTGAGGCLLTEPAEGLGTYFEYENEIRIFNDVDELVRKIRELQADHGRRDSIAWAGFKRTERDHTYEQRFSDLFAAALNRYPEKQQLSGNSTQSIDWEAFNQASHSHRTGSSLRYFERLLLTLCTVLWGSRRGVKAARRLVFEISWRLAGRNTYSAHGLPGRLFYKN